MAKDICTETPFELFKMAENSDRHRLMVSVTR